MPPNTELRILNNFTALVCTDVSNVFANCYSQDPAEDVEAAVKPAAKKSTKKSKKAAVKDEDIFKDDTDIFANIPAAKPKQPKTKKSKAQPKPLFGGETGRVVLLVLVPNLLRKTRHSLYMSYLCICLSHRSSCFGEVFITKIFEFIARELSFIPILKWLH